MAEKRPTPSWSDKRLVEECLRGDDQAWNALVDKYKNLVYAVVLRAGTDQDDAADLFQGVWLDAYNGLEKVRKIDSLKSWLITLAKHKCYHWRQKEHRISSLEIDDYDAELLEEEASFEPDVLEELERDQLVREAILTLNDRCQEMVQLLFFTHPPPPYTQVAEKLGLATGSIGFIRGRCLQKLQKALEKLGVEGSAV